MFYSKLFSATDTNRFPVSTHLLLLLCLSLMWVSVAWAQQADGMSKAGVTELANRAMSEFEVPGMAIGIVKSGKVVLAEGYGVREMGKRGSVNTKTLFKLASVSKAFTTAALATLVDDGSIVWDGLVIDYIPEFRMYDPWVTAGFTVTDLLTHRSGLAPYKGDMLLWPEPNAFTPDDVIHALRYFEPVSGFRTKYAYDNLLYIVAGEVVARVSGKSWGQMVESQLMRPAGMKRCFADRIPKRQMNNLAVPHGVIEGKLSVIERGRIPTVPPTSAAAGGIVCSLGDMLTWVGIQLNRGVAPDGEMIFSEAQSRQMWQPHTILGVSERNYELDRTHFKAYGLGWRLADVHGFKEVSHTGTLAGMRANVVLVPELDLGVVYLSNGSSSAARASVTNTIVRSYMPVEQLDWVQKYLDESAEEQVAALEKQAAAKAVSVNVDDSMLPCRIPDLSLFPGRYRDPWFGDVQIRLEDDQLMFLSEKSPKLKGPLKHHEGNQFSIRWIDRTLEADAYIRFEFDENGAVRKMSMSKLDRDGDYDYEDLDFTRVD